MTQEVHVLADEEQMTAGRTKQYEEETHTGIRTEKKKGEAREKKQEIVLKASIITKFPVSCYKAEPGTLSHDLPFSSYSYSQQRCQVSLLPLSSRPPVNKSTKTE